MLNHSILWLSISNGESHFRILPSECNGCESRTGYGGSEKEALEHEINEPLEIIMEVFMYKITALLKRKVALLLTGQDIQNLNYEIRMRKNALR